ncbi:MAG: hypothetical protein Ta2F_03570 [Termitinemataceae bacterium]|nr:MAG: hypothetical protein Ta2F_03570 [Termitinemataceae bacterium]
MKIAKKWSKMLRIGLAALVLSFVGGALTSCTSMPFQANQTPVSLDKLESATKSFKSIRWLGSEKLVQRMKKEGMTEILFIEFKSFLFFATRIVYTGR